MTEDERTEQAGDDTMTFAGPPSAKQVVDIARAVVQELEPEELPVFDQVADAWLRDGRRRRRPAKAPGASVGFGVEALLLSQLALPIIAAAVGEVLGEVTNDRLRTRRRAARDGDAKEVKPTAADTAKTGETAGVRDALTRQQLDALHDACQRHARTLGLSRAQAALLADAVKGSLGSMGDGG
jgi:hypothetical protein